MDNLADDGGIGNLSVGLSQLQLTGKQIASDSHDQVFDQNLEKELSGFYASLTEGKTEDLAKMYTLYCLVPKGLETLCLMFKQHVSAEVMALVNQAVDAANDRKGKQIVSGCKDEILVKKVIALHAKYAHYVTTCFAGNTLLHEALKDALSSTCNQVTALCPSANMLFGTGHPEEKRHGSCILGVRNVDGGVLGAKSFSLDNYRRYGRVCAVRCGDRKQYLVVDKALSVEYRRLKKSRLTTLTPEGWAEFTKKYCAARGYADVCYIFGSIERTPGWVAYGKPLPSLSPSLWRADHKEFVEIPVGDLYCYGTSSHLAEDYLQQHHTSDMKMGSSVRCVVSAYLEAASLECTGGKVKLVAITVDDGPQIVLNKDVEVLRAEMD